VNAVIEGRRIKELFERMQKRERIADIINAISLENKGYE
jgi:hypothetical protein